MKVNCYTCLEPLELSENLVRTVHRCPTCHNDFKVPEPSQPKPQTAQTAQTAIHSPAPQSVPNLVRKEASRPNELSTKPRQEEKVEADRFSFRIFGTVCLLVVFLVSSFVFACGIGAFHLHTFESGAMAEIQNQFYQIIGVTGQSKLTAQLAGAWLGKSLAPAGLALIALIAVSLRKRITAILFLTILVAAGFLAGTPILPLVCLILVALPGRSDVWKKA